MSEQKKLIDFKDFKVPENIELKDKKALTKFNSTMNGTSQTKVGYISFPGVFNVCMKPISLSKCSVVKKDKPFESQDKKFRFESYDMSLTVSVGYQKVKDNGQDISDDIKKNLSKHFKDIYKISQDVLDAFIIKPNEFSETFFKILSQKKQFKDLKIDLTTNEGREKLRDLFSSTLTEEGEVIKNGGSDFKYKIPVSTFTGTKNDAVFQEIQFGIELQRITNLVSGKIDYKSKGDFTELKDMRNNLKLRKKYSLNTKEVVDDSDLITPEYIIEKYEEVVSKKPENKFVDFPEFKGCVAWITYNISSFMVYQALLAMPGIALKIKPSMVCLFGAYERISVNSLVDKEIAEMEKEMDEQEENEILSKQDTEF